MISNRGLIDFDNGGIVQPEETTRDARRDTTDATDSDSMISNNTKVIESGTEQQENKHASNSRYLLFSNCVNVVTQRIKSFCL